MSFLEKILIEIKFFLFFHRFGVTSQMCGVTNIWILGVTSDPPGVTKKSILGVTSQPLGVTKKKKGGFTSGGHQKKHDAIPIGVENT